MADNNNNETTLDDVMGFLKDHMVTKEESENFATKDDLKNFATKDDLKNFATKDDLRAMEDRVMARLSEFQFELEDIKAKLGLIETRLKEDTDALAGEVVKLKKRVAILEQQLGIRQQQAVLGN